jgi:hypothetical protein
MKKNIYYLLVFVLITSCQIYGITNDFEKLSEYESSLVKELDSFSNTQSRNIYKINGQLLKNELKNNKKSIVYIFANGCSSKYCVSLTYLENYAKDNGYKLYMIMSDYAFLYLTLKQDFTSPLYSIDQEYYGTKFSSKSSRMFVNDITGKPLKDKIKVKDFATFFFYNNGILERATLKVTD